MKNKSVYAAALDNELQHYDGLGKFCKQFDSIIQAFEWIKKEHTEEEIIDMLAKLGYTIKTQESIPQQEDHNEKPQQEDWFHKAFIRNKQLMTQKEAAAYLGTTVGTLNTWRHHGRDHIPFIRWGNRIRYRKEDLDEWIKTHVMTVDDNGIYVYTTEQKKD